MRKQTFCISENKDADQLRGNRKADQRLCFRYIDSTIPLLSKSEISSLYPSSVAVQPSLCRTMSETPKTGFYTTMLKCIQLLYPKFQAFISAGWLKSCPGSRNPVTYEPRHEKTNILVSDQVRHKPGYTSTQDG